MALSDGEPPSLGNSRMDSLNFPFQNRSSSMSESVALFNARPLVAATIQSQQNFTTEDKPEATKSLLIPVEAKDIAAKSDDSKETESSDCEVCDSEFEETGVEPAHNENDEHLRPPRKKNRTSLKERFLISAFRSNSNGSHARAKGSSLLSSLRKSVSPSSVRLPLSDNPEMLSKFTEVDDETIDNEYLLKFQEDEFMFTFSGNDSSDHCREILDELIKTEKNYVDGLENLHCHFVLGLRAHCELPFETPILTEDEIRRCFLNVYELLQLNKQLLGEFKALRKNSSQMLEFSKLMLQYIPFFRIYTNYTDQYEDASILLKHLKKTSSKFLSFIKVREFCLRAKLDQLRSAPIQRIPRYMLLIKEMLKITPVESPNFYPLKFAFEEVQKISEKISDSIANAASKKEVFYLQNVIFKGKVDLVTSSRFCIRYAMMRKWTESKKPSSKEYFFILFDDCLCYALLSRDKKSAVMTHVLPLGRLMLEILPNSASRSNAFKIITSHKTIIVEASNEAVMNDWIQDLMTFCLLLESNYKTLSKSFPCGDELEKRVFETAAHHHSRSSMYASTKEASKKHSVIKNDSVLLLTEKQRQKFTRTARATLSSHNVTSMARRISATRRSLFITSFNRNIDMRSRIQEVV